MIDTLCFVCGNIRKQYLEKDAILSEKIVSLWMTEVLMNKLLQIQRCLRCVSILHHFFVNSAAVVILTADVIVTGTKTAQYISGTCHHHACNTCTHCLHLTYLAKIQCRRLRLLVISMLIMNGHHLEGCVRLSLSFVSFVIQIVLLGFFLVC